MKKAKIKFVVKQLKYMVGCGKFPFKKDKALIICEKKDFTVINKTIKTEFYDTVTPLEKNVYNNNYVFLNGWQYELFDCSRSELDLAGKIYGLLIILSGVHYDSLSFIYNEEDVCILWV